MASWGAESFGRGPDRSDSSLSGGSRGNSNQGDKGGDNAYQQMAQSLQEAGYGNLSKPTAPPTISFLDRYRDYEDTSFGDFLGRLFGRQEMPPQLSAANLSPYARAEWDVMGSPVAKGLAYAAGGPVLGGLYSAGIGVRDGKYGSAALSGLSGLVGGAAPLSAGAQMLGMANSVNSISDLAGGKTVDDYMGDGLLDFDFGEPGSEGPVLASGSDDNSAYLLYGDNAPVQQTQSQSAAPEPQAPAPDPVPRELEFEAKQYGLLGDPASPQEQAWRNQLGYRSYLL